MSELVGYDLSAFFSQVKALKEKIEAERGKDNFPVSGQKLIYAGKILQDDTPIKDYKIEETNFVVVMVSKVRFYGNTYGDVSGFLMGVVFQSRKRQQPEFHFYNPVLTDTCI